MKLTRAIVAGLFFLAAALGILMAYRMVTACGPAPLKRKDARTVEPLIKTLGDTDANVRRCAARAMGEIRDARRKTDDNTDTRR